ncbi:hypothetical protein Glove_105g5 [Diversispora epigaea]|uniref:Uncharacterized protein n=1 Tax=Diversispora epigaea TaxID=1348612 RepID=A0A397J304_9GLOM|nr:hypothetical protein Glove_105g5 [Diversispora epigaea]
MNLLTQDQRETNDVTLTEEENQLMETLLTEVSGREIIKWGKKNIIVHPPKEPQPPEVSSVNIVIKSLDPTIFPVQSSNTERMLSNLRISGLLEDVVGRNVKGRVRKYKGETKLRPAINIHDIVPKGHYIYALVLTNGQYVMLRHIRGRWFRALAYFTDHSLYSNFLDVYFTNLDAQ